MKLNQFGGSRTDTIVKLILVFFISLLSFSVGTFVGKQFSDSEHRLAALDNEYKKGTQEERETASIPEDNMEMEPSDILSKEDVAKLAEEFVAEKPQDLKRDVANVEKEAAAAPATPPVADTADPLEVTLKPAEKVAKGIEPAKAIKAEAKKVNQALPPTVASDIRGKYTIQVSSHQTELEAKARADDLASKGFVASYVQAVVEGKSWYRVGIGAFPSVTNAKEYLSKVREDPVFKGAIIRKIADERVPSQYN